MYESSHPSQQGQSWQDAHLRRVESQKGSHGTHNVTREIRQDCCVRFVGVALVDICIRLDTSLSSVCLQSNIIRLLIGCVFFNTVKVLAPLCMASRQLHGLCVVRYPCSGMLDASMVQHASHQRISHHTSTLYIGQKSAEYSSGVSRLSGLHADHEGLKPETRCIDAYT